MKSYLHFLAISLLFLAATNDSLTYVYRNGKKFISYKVKTGEGIYGLCKRFNVDEKQILDVNPSASKLKAGQSILIPVVSNSARNTGEQPPTSETSGGKKAVYYTVANGETLYRVAIGHHVKPEDIKKWNKLKNNNINPGDKLIVGYETTSADEVKSRDKASDRPGYTEKEDYIDPKYSEEYDKKQRKDKADLKEVDEQGVAGWIDDGSVVSNKSLALHKNAPPGTIIKITNLMNGRHQYVKVIGRLPVEAGSEQISIKITKTMAQKLGVLDKFFRVEMHYALETGK